MMIPKRLSAKVFANRPEKVDLAHVVPIFQRWIQGKKLEGMLIDVADYKHVHQGPGVMLVAHEGDYAFDTGNGRAGIKYTQKRDWQAETLADALRHILRLALDAGVKLEGEDALGGIGFDGAEIEFTFLDRLAYPNTPEAFATVQETIRDFAARLYAVQLYDDIEISIESTTSDPREPLTITLKVPATLPLSDLLQRLQVSAVTGASA